MAKLTPIQENMLQRVQFTPIRSKSNNIIAGILEAGFIRIYRNLPIYSEYVITPAGLAYLYQDAPMIDQPQPAPEVDNDDLPFSDVGKEDTQEVPTVTDDTLSNIIDAALDPDNQAAYEALKAYDFASTPLWVLNIEFSDLFYLKWQLVGKSPREAERAFAISDLLAEQGAKVDF